ncbi:MAG TPA: hypothetical protein PLG90_11165 [Ignavibacteria bacterium]|nr:hypothetical protein [Ignavibacteria bacterium]
MGIIFFIFINNSQTESELGLQTAPREELYFKKFGVKGYYFTKDESKNGFISNKRVNFKPGVSEPIIISQKNNLFIFCNDFTKKGTVTGYYSSDNGNKFYEYNLSLVNEFDTYADPDATSDNEGNIYFTSVERNSNKLSSIVLNISNINNTEQKKIFIESNETGKIKFDKPKIFVTENKLYVTYIKKESGEKKLYICISDKSGENKKIKLISDKNPDSPNIKYFNNKFYVSYSAENEIRLIESDSEFSYITDIRVTEFENPGREIDKQSVIKFSNNLGVRINSDPVMLISEKYNKIYIAYCGKNGKDNADIFFTASEINNSNFSMPSKVTNDNSINDQFLPAITEDENGNIFIIYQDSREDEKNIMINSYLSYSLNGGQNFSDLKISTSSFNPYPIVVGGNYMGDYNSVIISNDKLFSVWTDGRKGNFDIYLGILNLENILN